MSKRKDNNGGSGRAHMSSMITNGEKMSATGFVGMTCAGVALVVFLCFAAYFIIHPDNAVNIFEMMDKSLTILTIAAALLGVRKISGAMSSTFGRKIISVGGDDNDSGCRCNNRWNGYGYDNEYNDRRGRYDGGYDNGYNDGYNNRDYNYYNSGNNGNNGGYKPRYSTRTSTGSGMDYTMSAERSESEFDQLDG